MEEHATQHISAPRIRACLFHRGNKALMLVVHIIGFASICRYSNDRSSFTLLHRSIWFKTTDDSFTIMRGHGDFDCGNPPERQRASFLAIGSGSGGPRRNSDGAYRRRRVGLLQRKPLLRPQLFAEAFCIVMVLPAFFPFTCGRSSSFAMPTRQASVGRFLLLLAVFLARAATALWETRCLALCRFCSPAPPR